MSEPSPLSDPYAYMRNKDDSITRYPTRIKDILIVKKTSTWMRLYVPTPVLNGDVSSEKLPLVVYFHAACSTCSLWGHTPVVTWLTTSPWMICLPVFANRDHVYSNPTVGYGPDNMEEMGRLGWKVMVSGGEEDPLIDRQRDVAKLMKEKGVHVVERFTDGDVYRFELGYTSETQTLFASIRNFISSSAP
ncbi:unnamed protein product [Eruca vesicaria subsp. sativa]|uniref:Alpha/beta hydrolase fold-3 domain-containing protein n=1 Tax=Eruca vesicaria subsp. sativa TaxID=29727 RepID=A0ABC8LXN5_ERUVS|nr:unnamed protein product [Eruca vesicaria subsp. sativa]